MAKEDDDLSGLVVRFRRTAELAQQAAKQVQEATRLQAQLTVAILALRDAARNLADSCHVPRRKDEVFFTPEQEQRLKAAVQDIDNASPLVRN